MQTNSPSFNEKIFTVTGITQHIQMLFSSDPILQNITILGEISNYIHHSSGHMYFVLKDEKAQIRCVMFKGSALGLDFKPKDGLGVRAKGEVRVYEKRGEYQLYVSQMFEAGKGALFAAFEALKEKLRAEDYLKPRLKYYQKFLARLLSSPHLPEPLFAILFPLLCVDFLTSTS